MPPTTDAAVDTTAQTPPADPIADAPVVSASPASSPAPAAPIVGTTAPPSGAAKPPKQSFMEGMRSANPAYTTTATGEVINAAPAREIGRAHV